jgi:hypothetical protein
LGFFQGDHDFGAFFAFLFSVYWMFAPTTKGGANFVQPRSEVRCLNLKLLILIEGSLATEAIGYGSQAAAQGSS